MNAVTTVPQSVFVDGQAPVRYLVTSDKGFRKEVEFLLLGPYAAARGHAVKLLRLVSEYRWPIYLGGLLAMSVVACGVLVWVATRPDSPRPIKGYYEAARAWDADEAVEEASRQLGWTVRYELPSGVPHFAGMPRPVDVRVADRDGKPVSGLAGRLFAIRPSDTRLNQTRRRSSRCRRQAGSYRTLVRLDEPGTWELRIDTTAGGAALRPRGPPERSRRSRAVPEGTPPVTRLRETPPRRASPRVACAHCGLAVPPSLVREGEAEQFCCSGCRQVYTLVREWGFDQYYRLVDQQRGALEPARVTGRSFEDFDDERLQAEATEKVGADRRRTRLYLEGVHCAACVWLVEKLPAVLPGVDEVRLNIGSAVAEVTWRPGAHAPLHHRPRARPPRVHAARPPRVPRPGGPPDRGPRRASPGSASRRPAR